MKQLHSKVVCIATVVVVTAFAQAQTNEVGSASVQHQMQVANSGAGCTNGENAASADTDEMKALREAAESGDALAQWKFGRTYWNLEQDTATNSTEAVIWFRKAAEQGLAEAQYDLGLLYGSGGFRIFRSDGHIVFGCLGGVARDTAEAVKWYHKAAEQGHARAQFNLGVMYENGRGVEKDEAVAVEWYRKAAEQGHASAQYNLGQCYENGEGVDKDEGESAKWYRKVVDNNSIYEWPRREAMARLSDLYLHGKGVEKDWVEGVKWRLKIWWIDGLRILVLVFVIAGGCGLLLFKNFKRLEVCWFRKKARMGDAEAQYWLGYCYFMGWGVAQDTAEAVKWWRKAAEQGHKEAAEKLKGMNFKN